MRAVAVVTVIVLLALAACEGDECGAADDRCEGDVRVICIGGGTGRAALDRDACPRKETCVMNARNSPICARAGAPACLATDGASCNPESSQLIGICTALADGRLTWVDKTCENGRACATENGLSFCK